MLQEISVKILKVLHDAHIEADKAAEIHLNIMRILTANASGTSEIITDTESGGGSLIEPEENSRLSKSHPNLPYQGPNF